MADKADTMTAVSLDENGEGNALVDEIPLTPTPPKDTPTTKENNSDEDIDSLLEELHANPNADSTSTQEALENLRRSTTLFTSTIGAVTKNIDSKLQVSENAQHIDSKLGVSSTVASTVSLTSETVVDLWDKIQSSSTTQSIKRSVGETLHQGSITVGETVERTGISERIRDLDAKHGISQSVTQGTLGALATGMDFLNQSLVNVANVSHEEQDYDGLVSNSVDDESDLKIGDDQVKGD